MGRLVLVGFFVSNFYTFLIFSFYLLHFSVQFLLSLAWCKPPFKNKKVFKWKTRNNNATDWQISYLFFSLMGCVHLRYFYHHLQRESKASIAYPNKLEAKAFISSEFKDLLTAWNQLVRWWRFLFLTVRSIRVPPSSAAAHVGRGRRCHRGGVGCARMRARRRFHHHFGHHNCALTTIAADWTVEFHHLRQEVSCR